MTLGKSDREELRKRWKTKKNVKIYRRPHGGGFNLWHGNCQENHFRIVLENFVKLIEVMRERRLIRKDGSLVEPNICENSLFPGVDRRYVHFMAAYISREADTYLKAGRSAEAAGFCSQMGKKLLQRPIINMLLREILNLEETESDINTKLVKGIKARLADYEHRNWQQTADFVAKIRGDFAPEKHVNVNLEPEDREAQYAAIIEKVRGEQARLEEDSEQEFFEEESVATEATEE